MLVQFLLRPCSCWLAAVEKMTTASISWLKSYYRLYYVFSTNLNIRRAFALLLTAHSFQSNPLVSFARHILYLFVCGFSRFNPE
jgi:hypothetical protein